MTMNYWFKIILHYITSPTFQRNINKYEPQGNKFKFKLVRMWVLVD